MAAPHIHDLALIIDDLDRMGRLARVTSEVDPIYDLAGLAYRMEGGARAVLFEKVRGHKWPVFVGLYWNRDLLADVMRQDTATLPQYVADCIRRWQQNPIDPVIVPTGPVLELTENDVDLHSIPIPVHAEKDGGPYFDAAVVIAKDPETGVRNASIQRFMVVNKDTIHVNIDAGRHLELYLDKAKKLGKNLTFTLNCGVGPGLHFAASAPAEAAPPEADELGIASEFHGRPLELVKASNGYDDMVADAMWALECEMIPGEDADEGPFAEVTGYYAKVEPRPVVHVRKVHRRANPVFQTILSGMEVWNSVGLLGEANVLALLQRQVPGVTDVYFSHGGSGFYHAIVKLAQKRAGWSKQAIMAAFAAFPPLKMVTVVDDDVDIHSATDVEWAMATRLNPKTGVVVIDASFGHGLNPSFPDYLGPKVGFDATQPFPPRPEYERVTYKPMALESARLVEKEIHSPAPLAASDAPPGLPAHLVGKGREEIRAWEAELARPTRIDPADLRGVSRRDEDDDGADGDADAWIARPQPARLDVPVASARETEANDEGDDPDAWLARPQPAVLTPAAAAPAAPPNGRGAADSDVDLARPQPIDLAALGRRVGTAADAEDDPDAWIARPQPARFDIPEPPPLVDPAVRRAARTAARRVTAADPDAWLARPQPARFDSPAVAPAAKPTAKLSATPRAPKQGSTATAETRDEAVVPAAAPEPERADNGGAAAPDEEPAARPESRGAAAAFFETTTAAAAPRRAAARRGNGKAKARSVPEQPAPVADEEGGFFG